MRKAGGAPPSWAIDSYGTTDAVGATPVTLLEKTKKCDVMGFVSLKNMADGDTFVIKVYVKILPAGSYEEFTPETFVDEQTSAGLYVLPVISAFGVKITIEKSAGTDRTFDYFFKRRD